MTKPIFTGVATALVTPFLSGKVNYPLLKLLLKRQMDAGISAVVLSGTTGESPTLTDREKIEIFTQAKEYVGDECKIIAGTGSNSTAHAVALSQSAEAAGVDALLVVSPYYNKSTPDGLFAHFLLSEYSSASLFISLVLSIQLITLMQWLNILGGLHNPLLRVEVPPTRPRSSAVVMDVHWWLESNT